MCGSCSKVCCALTRNCLRDYVGTQVEANQCPFLCSISDFRMKILLLDGDNKEFDAFESCIKVKDGAVVNRGHYFLTSSWQAVVTSTQFDSGTTWEV